MKTEYQNNATPLEDLKRDALKLYNEGAKAMMDGKIK